MIDSAEILPFPGSNGLASLPMYTLPEIEPTVAEWWRGVARHMRAAGVTMVPDTLSKPGSVMEHWINQDLVFSQTCGFPLVYLLKGQARMVATPIYDAPGCDGPNYRSMIIVADDLDVSSFGDLRGLDAAVNSRDSQSGFNAFRALISTLPNQDKSFFGGTILTGSHEGSIDAVQNRTAHCACIDGVTLALFNRYRPQATEGIRILCETDSAPGLPFITHGGISEDQLHALRGGLFAALADPDLIPLAEKQLLKGASILELGDYGRISDMASQGAKVQL